MDTEDKNTEFSGDMDKREFVRFSVDIHLKFLDPQTKEEKEAQVLDVTTKGIGILTNGNLDSDTPLEMLIEVADGDQALYRKGRVVWSKKIEPNKYKAGIILEKVDLRGISRILKTIYGPNWL